MDKIQRKIAIKNFLSSPGFRIFAEEIATHVEHTDSGINAQLKGFMSDSGVNKLNFELGKRSGLSVVLSILEELKQELMDNSTGQS